MTLKGQEFIRLQMSGIVIKDIPNTILRVEVGSTAHGTGLPGHEDFDETVIWVETLEDVFHPIHDPSKEGPKATMMRTQPEGVRSGPGDTDRQCYALRRFLHLAAQGNPSIQMVFWAPVLETTFLGEELQRLGPAFISKKMIPRYQGYMQSQAKRILGTGKGQHGKRGNGGREELIEAHGYDTKYAMHCARLGLQCLELASKGSLELPMPPGHEAGDFLRAVRRGELSFDEWFKIVLDLDTQLNKLYDSDLPDEPDYDRIIDFSIHCHRPGGSGVLK